MNNKTSLILTPSNGDLGTKIDNKSASIMPKKVVRKTLECRTQERMPRDPWES